MKPVSIIMNKLCAFLYFLSSGIFLLCASKEICLNDHCTRYLYVFFYVLIATSYLYMGLVHLINATK